jgi:hypothetical protein
MQLSNIEIDNLRANVMVNFKSMSEFSEINYFKIISIIGSVDELRIYSSIYIQLHNIFVSIVTEIDESMVHGFSNLQ